VGSSQNPFRADQASAAEPSVVYSEQSMPWELSRLRPTTVLSLQHLVLRRSSICCVILQANINLSKSYEMKKIRGRFLTFNEHF
jgi:hypothetical protein